MDFWPFRDWKKKKRIKRRKRRNIFDQSIIKIELFTIEFIVLQNKYIHFFIICTYFYNFLTNQKQSKSIIVIRIL
jgi:hypothetical protein